MNLGQYPPEKGFPPVPGRTLGQAFGTLGAYLGLALVVLLMGAAWEAIHAIPTPTIPWGKITPYLWIVGLGFGYLMAGLICFALFLWILKWVARAIGYGWALGLRDAQERHK